MTNAVKAIPDGMTGFIPHLTCANAPKALDFYKAAFGAVEIMRMPMPDGRLMHASMQIDGATFMLHDEMAEWGALGPAARGGASVTIHRYVADVDAAIAQAVKAGATLKMPVAEMFWGDRYGVVIDPFGHAWSLATHQRDMTPDDMIAAGQQMMTQMPNCPEQANN